MRMKHAFRRLLCLLLSAAAQKFGKGVYFAPAILILAALCEIFGGSLVSAGLSVACNAMRLLVRTKRTEAMLTRW